MSAYMKILTGLTVGLVAYIAVSAGVSVRAAENQGQTNRADVQIVVGKQAAALERYAAKELQRYLYAISGVLATLTTDETPLNKPSFLVGAPETNAKIADLVKSGDISVTKDNLGAEGYVLNSLNVAGQPVLAIAGGSQLGTLYGVYGLLDDHYGVGFYLGGDVLPPRRETLELVKVDEVKKPELSIRGLTIWNVYPQGFDWYSWEDWTFIIDQLAKMRLNNLIIHNYSGRNGNDVFHNFTYKNFMSRVYSSTANRGGHFCPTGFGDVNQYPFGAADLFDDYDYAGFHAFHNESLTNEQMFRKGAGLFQRIIDHAHQRGVKITLAVDINTVSKDYAKQGLAVVPNSIQVIDSRLDQVLRDYPNLDYLIMSPRNSPGDSKKIASWRNLWGQVFAHVAERLKREAPNMGLGVLGWNLVPESISDWPKEVFAAPLQLSRTFAVPITNGWGGGGAAYAPHDFWGCFWLELDMDCYEPWEMPGKVPVETHNLQTMVELWKQRNEAPNMKGVFCLTWRVAGAVEPGLSFLSKAPWDNQRRNDTVEAVYRDYAQRLYGPEAGAEIAVAMANRRVVKDPEINRKDRDVVLAAIDKGIAIATDPGRLARLKQFQAREVAARDFFAEVSKRCRLRPSYGGPFPRSPFEIPWDELPGPFRGWYENLIGQVVDVSTLGNLICACGGSYVQMLDELQKKQAIKSPRLEVRGTRQGAILTWRNIQQDAKGFNVYRDGSKINRELLSAATLTFADRADGQYTYAVTAFLADGRESPLSVPAVCLAGRADKEPPRVVLVSPPSAAAVGQPVPIKVRVVDGRAHELVSGTLCYRTLGDWAWTRLPMKRRVKAVFADVIPASVGDAAQEYYVEVSDGDNVTLLPPGSPDRPFTLIRCDLDDRQAPATPSGFRAAEQGLTWQANTDNAFWYKIYRSRQQDFAVGPASFLTYVDKGTTAFREIKDEKETTLRDFDDSSMEGRAYYYRITAMDRKGNESPPTATIKIEYGL